MTIAEQLRQEGREQGREQGRTAGKRETLRKQLSLKFGQLDTATWDRIEAADEAALERFTERVLSASTLDEVLEN
jgi:predicted transposase YdaD